MALTTTADLQAAVADWLNRSDLSAQIPDFLELARLKINRRLDIEEQQTLFTVNPIAQTVKIPFGFIPISVSDSRGRQLEPVSIAEILLHADQGGASSRYSISGDDLYFAPTPSDSGSEAFKVLCTRDINFDDGVGSGYPVDGLVFQDIYLNAALQEAYVYLKDDGRVNYFKQMVDEGVANVQARRSKQGIGRARIKDDSIQANGGPLV